MSENAPQLHCIAKQESGPFQASADVGPQSARTGQWTADGTCIVQTTPDNTIETIVLFVLPHHYFLTAHEPKASRPEDLLDDENHHDLEPYSQYISSDPIYATALYPHFSLANPTTTLALYAARSTPIQLRNVLNYDQGIYATYGWFDPNTEEAITPHSLAFNTDASHFVAGSRAKFAVFDVNRPQANAIKIRATSKSRKAVRIYGEDPLLNATAPHSYITTMDINSDDVLAFGTATRHVALYADHGLGDLISSFRLPMSNSDGPVSGKGITQVKWSPDGTYLFIAERQSNAIEIYDMRHNRQRLSWLSGRQANVKYQLSFDIIPTLHGLEVWAGGTDGCVKLWSNPEQQQGEVSWTEQWHVHDDPVCSTLIHSSGSVVATLSLKDRYEKRNRALSSSSSGSNGYLSDGDRSSDASHQDNNAQNESEVSHSMDSVGLASTQSSSLKIWAIR